jgi:ligand-binding sensor domain-containing protein
MNRLFINLTILVLLSLPCSVQSQGSWKTYTRADGLASDSVACITQDKFGNYWFGTFITGLSKLDTNGVWSTFMSGDSLVSVKDIEIDSLNNKWLSIEQLNGYYAGTYIAKFDDSSFTYYVPTLSPDYHPIFTCLGKDAAGHIWCGTYDKFAFWFDGIIWHPHYVAGTWGDIGIIYDIKADHNGKLYFAHYRGISTLEGYLFGEGWMWTRGIAFDKQNRLWFGSGSDKYPLGMFDGEKWYGFTVANGLRENNVWYVAVDSSNNIWIAYGDEPGVSKFDGHTFIHFTKDNGLAHDMVHEIYVDRKGDIWFGTRAGVSVLHDTTTNVKKDISLHDNSDTFSLFQNFPNPFNSMTTIKYILINDAKVELLIYDLMGQEVMSLINKRQPAGTYQVLWNGTNNYGKEVSSGIYLAVLKTGNFQKSLKLILIH